MSCRNLFFFATDGKRQSSWMVGLCVTISRQILHIRLGDSTSHVITSLNGSLNKFVRRHRWRDFSATIYRKITKSSVMTFNIFFWQRIFAGSAVPRSLNSPTDSSCVNWNQYYTNCTQLGGNPFQGTISFDNIGLAWVAIFLVIISVVKIIFYAD